jgi:hypothetical protein
MEAPDDGDAAALFDLAHDVHARVEAVAAWVEGRRPTFSVGAHTTAFAELVAAVEKLGEAEGEPAEVGT